MTDTVDGRRGLCDDTKGVHMLIIDPQVDFHHGSLPVPGACEDVQRYSNMILDNIDEICQIHATLDTHHKLHIAHGAFWENKDGDSPAPFTIITADEIEEGKWTPRREEFKEHAVKYTKSLEADGKFKLIIWPEHCLIGTPGHNVMPTLQFAFLQWGKAHNDCINFVNKGENPLTESYSALCAEYKMETDTATHTNTELIERLLEAERILICGEAKSHCVNYTVRDLVNHWPKERLKDLWILEDGMSPVGGFEADGDKFVEDMRKMGLTVTTCAEAFA